MIELVLKFKTQEDRAAWIAWYLDGGGEQQAGFYTDTKQSNWLGNDQYLALEFSEFCRTCNKEISLKEFCTNSDLCNSCYKKYLKECK